MGHLLSPKAAGGLDFIDSYEAVTALLGKWIIAASEPGNSNFKTILRHKLCQAQPTGVTQWESSMDWFQMHDHKCKNGSHVWNRISKAWKILVKFTYVRGPDNFEEWLSLNFWWGVGQNTLGPGFSKTRGTQLYKAGLKRNVDVWDFNTNSIKSLDVVHRAFGVRHTESQAWKSLRQRLTGIGGRWINQSHNRPLPDAWYGVFVNHQDSTPGYVLQGSSIFSLR